MSRSTRIRLAGLDLVPDLSGALYVPDYRTLIVADLHFEKGSSLARRGVHLPPYDTRETLLLLQSVIASVRPQRLVSLGDAFHDGEAPARLDGGDLARIEEIASMCETIWISGNHDPAPPMVGSGIAADHLILGPLSLRHEPRALMSGECEIAGHLHPAATLSQRGQQIRRRCFIANERRMVMPAFGSFTGSLPVSADPISRLFTDGDFHVWMLGSRAVHRFPGRRVR